MPGPFRLRPRADETQPLGIARQIDCDRELTKFAAMRPRTEAVWRSINYWLDRRYRLKRDAERPWCGAPRDLGGQQPCPLTEPCDNATCRIGREAANESYGERGGEGGS
jgi:hypothetical protein